MCRRLGFIIDFLSKATLIGFMGGAAIIVSLQQLKSLLGIQHFTKKMGIVPVLTSVFHNTHESIQKPKLFWVSAGAPLVSVILSTLLVFAFKAQNHGITVIGKLQQGLNPPSWNMLHFHGSYLGLVIKTGLVTGIISLTEGIAVGRTFAALKNYEVDGNKEMIAIGAIWLIGTNVYRCIFKVSSKSQCRLQNCSFQHNNGGHGYGDTPLPHATLSVHAKRGLRRNHRHRSHRSHHIPAACEIWKIDKFDFIVMLCAFLGVLFISVQNGLAIAVGISIFKILIQITRPKTVMLGNIPGTDIYRDLHHYKEAVSVPGFLILSIEAPINFANSTYLKERIMRWVEECESGDEHAKKQSGLKFVILDLSAVSAIDTNGVSFFKDLRMTLEKRNLELVLVNPLGEVIEKLQRADDARELARPDSLFLTVGQAVAFLLSTIKRQSSKDSRDVLGIERNGSIGFVYGLIGVRAVIRGSGLGEELCADDEVTLGLVIGSAAEEKKLREELLGDLWMKKNMNSAACKSRSLTIFLLLFWV
ncbi:hypothetical protein DH2020_020654 [Rehmannia glutinosa]|uniref:STAS domain-containing protein n=1 Tax=Rehmannia glutinosa TaxID=99300 RepID=A0ABR0WKW1_REHGL